MTLKPNYIKLLETGDLYKKVKEAQKHLTNCTLCPHQCGVNRKKEVGICQAGHTVIVSSYGPHLGEERVLVGSKGSGTIFFGYCNMSCVFCQNYTISSYGHGDLVSNESLAEMMLSLQNQHGCHNVNLVTPTHYVPNILEAIYLAAQKGLELPIVYNCGGYESVDTLKILDGVIDIYMPDFKYNSFELGKRYSKVLDYPTRAKEALLEMDRQVGGLKTDHKNIAYKGVLIRHLMLPGGLKDTKGVLEFIKEELSSDVLVNLMDQYYPSHKAFEYKEIAKRLDGKEYKQAYTYGKSLGLRLI
ncbi:MAG: radical SAM protein [Sphaerochaetaceae bacterium]|jgi:putative pyruvate formate lyase activating enzyme|nr:radical SAM protein [Sphaerochaetaceae bacterium]